MNKRYGKDYKSKMTTEEKKKYDKLEKDLSDISEAWWDAAVRQQHEAASKSAPTLKDNLNKAQAEYDRTLLGKYERRKKRK